MGAWAGAGVVALYQHSVIQPWLHFWLSDPLLNRLVSMGLAFCLSLAVFLLLAQWMAHAVRASMAQSVDRALGLAFGAVRGMAIVWGVYVISLVVMPLAHQPSLIRMARSTVWLQAGVRHGACLLPLIIRQHPCFQENLEALTRPEISAQTLSDVLSAPPVHTHD